MPLDCREATSMVLSIMMIEVLAMAAGLVALFLWRHNFAARNLKPLPPGPAWSWPILGIIPSLSPNLHRDFSRMATKYGPIFSCRIGTTNVVVVASSPIAREVLTVKDLEFCDRPEFAALKEITHGFQAMSFGPMTDTSVRIRRILARELMTRDSIKSFAGIMREDGAVMLRSIYDEVAKNGGQGVVDVRCRISAFVSNMGTQIVLRKRFHGPVITDDGAEFKLEEDSPKKLVLLLTATLKLFGTFNLSDFIPALRPFDLQGVWKKGKQIRIQYDKILAELIQERREFHSKNPELIKSSEYVKDFLDVLLLAQEQEKLTDLNIQIAVIEVLGGTLDTIEATIEWALALLIRYPEHLKRVQEEMDRVIGRDRLVEEHDLHNLPVFKATFKECVRFLPVVPITSPRQNRVEAELGGYRIPKRSCLFVLVDHIVHDPSLWENPHEFNPNRFLETSNVDFQANGDNFTLLPFSFGRRGCPGKPLGLASTTYAVALLVQSLDWAPPPGVLPHDFDLSEAPLQVVRCKAAPLLAMATPRLSHQVYMSLAAP